MLQQNKKSYDLIEKVKKEAFTGQQTLEEEVKTIRIAFEQYQIINKNLTEIRTKNWLDLGEMLKKHRTNVEKAGYCWTIWASEHLLYLKPTRCKQCMKLASLGTTLLEQYYYMGIDRLYNLFMKLIGYQNDPDFEYIKKNFNFFKVEPQTEEEKAECNNQADMILEFFKFKNNITLNGYDKNLLMNVVKTGYQAQEKDYENISQLTTNEDLNSYLLSILINGSIPSTKKGETKNESIHILMAKLDQTVNYILSTSSFEFIEIQPLKRLITNLISLEQRL